ncbi:MAG: DUF2924 domain-containing protein [Planctomycetaceae bacterium]
MALNVAQEVAVMQRMTVRELKLRYAEVFGELPRSGNKQWLLKRIAWRIQANAEGDLSERARRRAMELADDADVRMTPPRQRPPKVEPDSPVVTMRMNGDSRLPMPGAVLTRSYKDRKIAVTVRTDGFEYEGSVYKSLSAVTKAVTGKHWNGYHFFGLGRKGT